MSIRKSVWFGAVILLISSGVLAHPQDKMSCGGQTYPVGVLSGSTAEGRFMQAVLDHDKDRVVDELAKVDADKKRYLLHRGLVQSSWIGSKTMVVFFLSRGVDADSQDPKYGATALELAAYCGRMPVMQTLLSHGADMYAVPAYSNNGYAHSAFDAAVMNKQDAAALWLLRHGFDFCRDGTAEHRRTMLRGARMQHMQVAKKLDAVSCTEESRMEPKRTGGGQMQQVSRNGDDWGSGEPLPVE